MKEFFKKLWEKVKALFLKLWEKVKAWFLKTAWPWIKKSWIQIVNVLVVIYGYGKLDDAATAFGVLGDAKSEQAAALAALLLGAWAFLLLVYWIFWKLLGLDKVFYKWLEQRKKEKQTPK